MRMCVCKSHVCITDQFPFTVLKNLCEAVEYVDSVFLRYFASVETMFEGSL